METILNEEGFKNSDIVVCGHSLGGAIASIVTIRLQMEKVHYFKEFCTLPLPFHLKITQSLLVII